MHFCVKNTTILLATNNRCSTQWSGTWRDKHRGELVKLNELMDIRHVSVRCLKILSFYLSIGRVRSCRTRKLLDVHPLELYFPFERNKLIRCPVTLTNRTEDYVGVWITLIYPDIRSGLRFPVVCGKESLEGTEACSHLSEIMGPHSTLAVPMTMEELWVSPQCDRGKFEVLMIVMSQKEHLEKLKASNMDGDFLKRAQELEGTVHRVILKAAIRDQTRCQAVIANYKVSLICRS